MEMPIPNDWDGETFCRYMVCWPDSTLWRAILLGQLTEPGRGWFWDANTGHLLDTLTAFRSTMDENISLRGVVMACNDDQFTDLLAALGQITAAITAQQHICTMYCSCGGGGGGGGGWRPTPELGQPGEDPPPGYDWPEDEFGEPALPGSPAYQNRLCKVANMVHEANALLLDKIAASEFWTWTAEIFGDLVLDLMSAAIGYIVGEVTTAIPWVDGIVGAIIGWNNKILEAALGETDIPALVQALQTYETDLVCALYENNNAWDGYNAYVQVLVDNGLSVGNQAVINAVFVPQLVNVVYYQNSDNPELEAALVDYVGPVDCGECACQPFILSHGEWDGVDTFSSESDAGIHRLAVMVNSFSYNFDGSGYCGPLAQVDFGAPSAGSPAPGSGEIYSYRVYDDSGQLLYGAETPWPESICGRVFYWRRDAPFTVALNGVTDCEV